MSNEATSEINYAAIATAAGWSGDDAAGWADLTNLFRVTKSPDGLLGYRTAKELCEFEGPA